ncbi:flagellar hook-basal body protein [Botrimarina hoheduenensis]|uniref:Flagellar basal-body rod protein FlgG n=1 Tax=Botrimarina hoheduenensis TaxID=2528000 RepID=A0A5C5VXH0_9BACT|nr:flagellar hook basal-body protein [Botrimarina hoheduenensis]TWT42685.1 Flagellar basal-body rod protein FlgG [Botrimarina hoheduenensis]
MRSRATSQERHEVLRLGQFLGSRPVWRAACIEGFRKQGGNLLAKNGTMSYGMYLAAEGAQAQSKRLQVIANNIANVDTVGFKPDVAVFQSRYAEAIQQGKVPPYSRTLNDQGGGVKTIETRTDYSAGQLQRTGDRGDVAIIGEGFFVVQGEQGEPLLTRAGSMIIDAQNRLVSSGTGRPMLDTGGGLIEVTPDQPWEITADGALQQGSNRIPLALEMPASLGDLTKVGSNAFRSRTPTVPVPTEGREVRAGWLEMSRSNATQQMMAMIETQRAFEANTQMIRHQDEATGSLIGRVLSA